MKIRLIPILFYKNGNLVRSENFDIHQILGDPVTQVKRYNSWDIDEIIYINISNGKNFEQKNKSFFNKGSFQEVMSIASKECFSPIGFGGGINNLEDAKKYFQNGADKISINSLLFNNIDKLNEFANVFGSQSIIASIDVKKINNQYKMYSAKNNMIYDHDILKFVKDIEKRGAGEILLNSVDKDGMGKGYDINLIKAVNDAISIPLIPCGGVGKFDHFSDLLSQIELSAIAAGNIFNFTERSYEKIKQFLKDKKYNFR